MLMRRSVSGKHILIWALALLTLGVALWIGSLILRALLGHPTLGLALGLARSGDAELGAAARFEVAENRAQRAE